MRTIKKRLQPQALTEWRASRIAKVRGPGMECTYEEVRRTPAVLESVEDGVLAEQGGICAYTGHAISLTAADPAIAQARKVRFHLEHLLPQEHCGYGQDADYGNLVACWPRPNCGFEPAYGARKKGSWPDPTQEHLFVSPLRSGCAARFMFNHKGMIQPAIEGDAAAAMTITRLGLDDGALSKIRKNAIRGVLQPRGRYLTLNQTKTVLHGLRRASEALDSGASIELKPFCFVLEQALEQHLETIMKQRPADPSRSRR